MREMANMSKHIQQRGIFFAAAVAALAAFGGGISVELPKDPCDTLRIAADAFGYVTSHPS